MGRPVEEFGAEQVISTRGELGQVTAKVQDWEAAGGTHILISTMGLGLDSAEAHLDRLAQVAEALDLTPR